MSRIFGFHGVAVEDPHDSPLSSMGSALAFQPTWNRQDMVLGRSGLGYTGRVPGGSLRAGNLMATVDGRFFNSEALEGDTEPEMLIGLYRRHGFAGALARINGDFAVALYDSALDTLWLGRDRFGVKPLYHADHQGIFWFASQSRGLLAVEGLNRQVNDAYLGRYAATHYRYIDNEPHESPYIGIAQLPAAHLLRVTGTDRSIECYWSLADAPDAPGTAAALAEEYRTLLLDAVKIRAVAAEAPAFTLSGGMDSSSVLACASEALSQNLHAFSSIYSDKIFDESEDIQPMLKSRVQEWHPVPVEDPDVFGLVQKMIEVHDEPIATATWLSHFLVCEEVAANGFRTLFGGLGGDELNAGEYEYFLFHFADLRADDRQDLLAVEIREWAHHHDHPIYRKSEKTVERDLRRLVDRSTPGRCLPDRSRIERYAHAVNPDFFDPRTFTPKMDHPFGSYLKNRTFQDLFRETSPCCLRAEDRQTTAADLDHADPFFDHRLAELMFRVPGSLKIRDGVTKRLLRDAMKGILPEETRTRVAKTGWNAPAHSWFAGTAGEKLKDVLASQAFRQRGIYQVDEVQKLLAEHEEIIATGRHRENHMMFFWQLTNVELWLQGLGR